MSDPLRDLRLSLGSGYSIIRELGGGMSHVFLARDETLRRHVVVKLLAPALAEGVSAERFAREIRVAAALQEPRLVPVLTAGVTRGGLPYYTMPFVSGESLRATAAVASLNEAVGILRAPASCSFQRLPPAIRWRPVSRGSWRDLRSARAWSSRHGDRTFRPCTSPPSRSDRGRGYYSVAVSGGTPRLLRRLDAAMVKGTGGITFTSDRNRLHFTIAADEADVWTMALRRR